MSYRGCARVKLEISGKSCLKSCPSRPRVSKPSRGTEVQSTNCKQTAALDTRPAPVLQLSLLTVVFPPEDIIPPVFISSPCCSVFTVLSTVFSLGGLFHHWHIHGRLSIAVVGVFLCLDHLVRQRQKSQTDLGQSYSRTSCICSCCTDTCYCMCHLKSNMYLPFSSAFCPLIFCVYLCGWRKKTVWLVDLLNCRTKRSLTSCQLTHLQTSGWQAASWRRARLAGPCGCSCLSPPQCQAASSSRSGSWLSTSSGRWSGR